MAGNKTCGKILIRNGRVVDPASGRDEKTDLFIADGRVARIGETAVREGEGAEVRVIDAEGMVVAPGLIDGHVHFRDPGFPEKEDIFSGARAAAAGGFTTVICMANTKPVADSAETLQYILDRARNADIRVRSSAAVSVGFGGRERTDFEGLLELGATGFTDDGLPLRDPVFVREALLEARRLGVPVSMHEEDPDFIGTAGINDGKASGALGCRGAKALAENLMVARDCMLALDTGARVNIQHISAAESVAMVRMAKKLGADVWAEATPHHFSFTEDLAIEKGSLAKVNPPIRTERDRQAILEGLCDGTIQMIVTDHAPHTAEEKARPLAKAPSGMIGLETSLALGITNLVRPGILSLTRMLEKMTVNPAAFYGLDAGKIREGGPADLVIFREDESWTVTEDSFRSRSSNSPFIGMTLFGKVRWTICGGIVVYQA